MGVDVVRFAVLGLALIGCPHRTTGSGGDAAAHGGPVFIEIDLSEEEAELDELDGLELRRVTSECGNTLDLEPTARLGRLTEGQIRCLNGALDEATRQTIKDKLSRVLLSDAWAKGDTHRWMGVAERHLSEVEQSDPDLVYQFAFQLVGSGNPDRMDEAVHWADVALENKQVWEGDLYVRRVYGLYKVRTLAALKKWEYYESKHRTTPTDPLSKAVELSRNQVKTYAREWLDYAKSAGRDTTEALRLCAMAAGTNEFCSQEG